MAMSSRVGKYKFLLSVNESLKHKIKNGLYALPDCDQEGIIPKNTKYVILKRLPEEIICF